MTELGLIDLALEILPLQLVVLHESSHYLAVNKHHDLVFNVDPPDTRWGSLNNKLNSRQVFVKDCLCMSNSVTGFLT